MQSAPGTPSSRQLAATPQAEFAFSSSSPAHGGGQGGSRPPPNFPRFNLPASYWTRTHIPSIAEQVFEQAGVRDHIQQRLAESREGQDNLLKAIENQQQERENDPRTRIQGMQFQLNIRPIQVPDIVLSPDILAGLVKLNDPDDMEPQAPVVHVFHILCRNGGHPAERGGRRLLHPSRLQHRLEGPAQLI